MFQVDLLERLRLLLDLGLLGREHHARLPGLLVAQVGMFPVRIICFTFAYFQVFLLYLSLPQTRGAQQLYAKVVDPAISRIEAQLAAKSQ